MADQIPTYHAAAKTPYDRLLRSIREGRLGAAIRRMLANGFRAYVYAQDDVLVFCHRAAEPVQTAVVPGLSMRLIGDAADDSGLFRHPLLAGTEGWFAEGDRVCIATFDDTRLAHSAWVRFADRVVTTEAGPRCEVRLPSVAAILYYCTTGDEFRGYGIYPAVLTHLMKHFGSQGLDTWIYSRASNRGSIRGIEKAGFRLTHRFVRTRILHWIETSQVTTIEESENPRSADQP